MTVPPTQPKRRRSRVLVLLGSACALALGTVALIMPGAAKAAVCSNQTGTNGGMYYQMWSGQGSACITLNSRNSYSTSWSGIGDFVAGVG